MGGDGGVAACCCRCGGAGAAGLIGGGRCSGAQNEPTVTQCLGLRMLHQTLVSALETNVMLAHAARSFRIWGKPMGSGAEQSQTVKSELYIDVFAPGKQRAKLESQGTQHCS